MICVIVVGGPCEPYVNKSLLSIKNQKFVDWKACVVVDPVGDKAGAVAKLHENEKIKVIQNTERNYAIPNIIKAIKELNPKDEDILITVDLDDWLAHDNVFSIIHNYYTNNPNLLLTYGSWMSFPNPNIRTNCSPYIEDDFKNGIRKTGFRATHLRTFKYKLWKHIKDEDLKDHQGNYFTVTWDLAFAWPMVEMAGFNRTQFVPEKLYVYNQETPHNDHKLQLQKQMFYERYLVDSKVPYTYTENL